MYSSHYFRAVYWKDSHLKVSHVIGQPQIQYFHRCDNIFLSCCKKNGLLHLCQETETQCKLQVKSILPFIISKEEKKSSPSYCTLLPRIKQCCCKCLRWIYICCCFPFPSQHCRDNLSVWWMAGRQTGHCSRASADCYGKKLSFLRKKFMCGCFWPQTYSTALFFYFTDRSIITTCWYICWEAERENSSVGPGLQNACQMCGPPAWMQPTCQLFETVGKGSL